jgi:hypothetical protein
MRRLIQFVVIALSSATLSCATNDASRDSAAIEIVDSSAGHGVFAPEQIQWQDGPPSLPAGAKFAILEGDPAKPGYFAMRLQLPDGYQIPPHWHPNVERLTVISGTFNLGMGERFDRSGTQTMPIGTYAFMPPHMEHFAWVNGPTVVQLTTIGPWEINYINPSDDPRQTR